MSALKGFMRNNRSYFAHSAQRIAQQNSHMLETGCVVYALVLLFYTTVTVATGQSKVLSNMYYLFDTLHVALCIAVFFRRKERMSNLNNTCIYSALFEISILSFFAVEAVFPFKDQSAIYIPIAILLIILLFIHTVRYMTVLTLLYLSAFVVMSYLYKMPIAFKNDVYIAMATFIASEIGYFLITSVRQSEDRALRELRHLSEIDMLTNLYNKETMTNACIKQCERMKKDGDCAFFIIDLDEFKNVNDRYGHDCGDAVLKMVADALRACLGEGALIGRFGGDEFIAMIENSAENSFAQKAAEILKEINALEIKNEKISCSVGVTALKCADTFVDMFERADKALYKAKSEGKNRFDVL